MLTPIKEIFPNENLFLAVFFIAVILLVRIGFSVLSRITLKLSVNKDKSKQQKFIKRTSLVFTILAIAIAVPLTARLMFLSETILNIINNLSKSVIFILVSVLIYTLIDIFMVNITTKMGAKNSVAKNLQPIIRGTVKIIFIAIASVYLLVIWGVQVGPLLAGLGIAGLALALALQPTLGNLFNGIALILDETFKVGDVVKLSTGEIGEVYRVGLRTTKIRTFDNEMFIIPNTKIADSMIQNFFQPDRTVRVGVEFGVEYGADPEYIKQITLDEINKITFTDKKQEARIMFTDMGDSSLNFKAMFWVDDISKRWPAHQEAITRIYRRLYKEGIGIPFPQRTVWLREEGKAKAPSPQDKKFKKVQNKYYPNFGYEYKDETDNSKKEDKKQDKK